MVSSRLNGPMEGIHTRLKVRKPLWLVAFWKQFNIECNVGYALRSQA
jgi:hypothetical protein